MRILMVDDDCVINNLVQEILTREGYEVETIDDEREAMQTVEEREPDLLILDVKMPYIDGFEFSKKLRAKGYKTPFIFLTGQGTLDTILQGFDIGAEDCIRKPIALRELVARVKAVTRRVRRETIRSGRMELFPTTKVVVIDGNKPIPLTPTEARLLHVLMSYAGQIVSRSHLLEEVWNDDRNSSNVLTVYIGRLRSKLEIDPRDPHHIVLIHGSGYKFVGN